MLVGGAAGERKLIIYLFVNIAKTTENESKDPDILQKLKTSLAHICLTRHGQKYVDT